MENINFEMSEKSKLNLDRNKTFKHDIKKNDLLRISPTAGSMSNLNKAGDIVFQSLQSANPLDICNARLYYKIELEDIGANEDITLENNFFPHLFSNMRLKLGSTEVENILEPGVYSSMLNFILTDEDYKKEYGQMTGWIPDTSKGDNDATGWDANFGYMTRKNIYNTKKKFEGIFELKHLFGFLQNFDRVLHNVFIELICNRQVVPKLLFYGAASTAAKLKINTLELHIPSWTLNPRSELKLLERLNTNKSIHVNYLNRICTTISMGQESTYSVKLANLAYRPRYILIGFKDSDISFQKNNNLFIQKDGNNSLKSIQIQLNNTYYPINKMDFDVENNENIFPYETYVQTCKDFKTRPQLSLEDYKNLYSIFCIDVSSQDDKLAINNIDVTLHITKDSDFKAKLYTLILEEKAISMRLSGGKVAIIEPVRGDN